MQREAHIQQRKGSADRRRLSAAQRLTRESFSPRAAREAPKVADAAKALRAQQAVMVAVQERRLQLMDGALAELNDRLEALRAHCEMHGLNAGADGHWPGSDRGLRPPTTRVVTPAPSPMLSR